MLAARVAVAGRRRGVWRAPHVHLLKAPRLGRVFTTQVGDGATKDYGGRNESVSQRNVREFEMLPALLRVFREATGHQIVPYHFVIPLKDDAIEKRPAQRVVGRVRDAHDIAWPDDARGINFGRTMHKFATNEKHQKKHPQVARLLHASGYPLDAHAVRQSVWDEQIMPALRTFYKIHAHTLAPVDFVVPRDDPGWPVTTWGYILGERVVVLRRDKDKLTASELADLKSVEFSFNVSETMWSDYILPALQAYTRVNGNCRVPKAFEVPHTGDWSRKAWGLKLGYVVQNIRSLGRYAHQVARDKSRLQAIGFVWDDAEYQWSEVLLPSLEVFFRLKGHCLVPQSFVVPREDPWPSEAGGVKLGVAVNDIRVRDNFAEQTTRDAARLDAIKFVWDVNDHKWTRQVFPSLETFAGQFGHCDVPHSFVVPSTSPWPEDAWGLRLGGVVTNIRARGDFAVQRKRDNDRLDALGFVWDHRAFQWTERILASLEAFHAVYGHSRVPVHFEVPSDSPWPQQAWGLQLGTAVRRIRGGGAYAEFVARDAARLDAIGFVVERASAGDEGGLDDVC